MADKDKPFNPFICDRCGKDVEGLAPNDFIEHVDIRYCGLKYTISFQLCQQCCIELRHDIDNFIFNHPSHNQGKNKNIGERIANIVNDKGITFEELSRRVGISPSLLSQYVHGQRTPKTKRVVEIADALGVSPWDIDDRLKHS